jgi:diadenosine tetraphosphate (Ap4A) HIT family hydrolase
MSSTSSGGAAGQAGWPGQAGQSQAGQAGFTLHPTLAADTVEVTRLPLSRVLLRDDRTFPWVILVPERARTRELFELPCDERGLLMEEIALVSTVLRDLYQPHKINVAALGNQVEQLHVHVIARFHHDAAWPRPIWGVVPAVPYGAHERQTLVGALQDGIARGRDAFGSLRDNCPW